MASKLGAVALDLLLAELDLVGRQVEEMPRACHRVADVLQHQAARLAVEVGHRVRSRVPEISVWNFFGSAMRYA